MNKFKVILAGLLMLGALSSPAYAETTVGVVNFLRMMEEAPQAKAAQTKIESEFAPREQELVALQKEIRKLEDKLAKDGAVMSESQSNKLERQILSKGRDLKRSREEFRDDLNIRKNEVTSQLQRQMLEATRALAKEKGFDIILGQGVVYADKSADITDMVLERLTSNFKSGGGK
ncbi:periplasmic chaperone for outer membrane proteins Skp [Thiogranum longum]|uniref:Periplasmic chaperone for outer membrane proteins Skp n=1 Tax=Thiogranum longum TaxID=1537524 RepID=A0A4R1HAS5_9GAMM|nr:OmpH family outer membrane protein [Thiogranum longum]TCK18448.1 periplasmic chaperone for outer membrane proteins Skp [Thiogranum longum]